LPEGASISDGDIAAAIQRHLLDERVLRTERVQVAVTHGIAALSGSVSNLLAKERAVSVAETIRGVRSVVDEVSVAAIPRTEAQLEGDVATALHTDSATRSYTIGVKALTGTVTLSGTADSWQEKNVISEVTKTVPGVKALINAMTVEYATSRPDAEIATDVRRRIANDVWLAADTLAVQVGRHEPTAAFPRAGTVVTLVGTVTSVAEKSRAGADAWVAGVDKVDVDGIAVDWFAQDERRRTTDAPLRSDEDIAEAVRDAFRTDPRLRTMVPQLGVQGGEVVLRGTVDSLSARRAAAADAMNTVGVLRVRNEVLVVGTRTPTDEELDRAIKRALSDSLPSPEGKAILVSSAGGRVTLKGEIPTGLERLDVIAEVKSVPGVFDVNDDLTVAGPPRDIKAGVEERLFWDPRVEHELVSVAVSPDGAAILTGTVNAWSEIRAARDDALRGGATRVTNMLQVRKHVDGATIADAGSRAD
jgi:osmotically-inducible protein OsmY